MTTTIIKPASAGLIVRDPLTARPLDEKGEAKPMNGYWHARLREGSVVEVAAKSGGKKSPSAASQSDKQG